MLSTDLGLMEGPDERSTRSKVRRDCRVDRRSGRGYPATRALPLHGRLSNAPARARVRRALRLGEVGLLELCGMAALAYRHRFVGGARKDTGRACAARL